MKIRECSSFLDWSVLPVLFSGANPFNHYEWLIRKSMHLERCSVPAGMEGQEQKDGCIGVDVKVSTPDGSGGSRTLLLGGLM